MAVVVLEVVRNTESSISELSHLAAAAAAVVVVVVVVAAVVIVVYVLSFDRSERDVTAFCRD